MKRGTFVDEERKDDIESAARLNGANHNDLINNRP